MGIIKFIWEIIKRYLGLIITLLIMYIIYKSYYALDKVSVRGGYYTLYNVLGKSINFIFDRVPKLFIQIPQFKIPSFGFLLRKIPKIPSVPNPSIPSINKPGDCGFPFPNPLIATPPCAAKWVFEGGKYVARGLSKAFGWMCITENSLILMSDNSVKMIKELNIGDEILNINGNINKIFYIHKDFTDKDIEVYGINDVEPFFTETHPIISGLDKEIVLSLNPELTELENPERHNKIKKLEIGDIVLINNKKVKIDKITSKKLEKKSYVYDLMFEDMNDNSYIANNIGIESQEPNYIKNSPIIGYIISEIANIYYDKRDNKKYIEKIIKIFIINNRKYLNNNNKEIVENRLKLKLFINKYFENILCKIKNNKDYKFLGKFISELWISYYSLLIEFNNISLKDLSNLKFKF